jgi:hypothetical protein
MLFQRSLRPAQRNARNRTRNPRYAPELLEGRLNPSGFVPTCCTYAPVEYNPVPLEVNPTPPSPAPVPTPLPPAPDPILPPCPDPIPPGGPALTD